MPDVSSPSHLLKCDGPKFDICPVSGVAAAGVPDLLQQRGSRSSEWHRGVQIPVCMGPLELPRESSAAVHTQQPAQRWVQTPTRPPRDHQLSNSPNPNISPNIGWTDRESWLQWLLDYQTCFEKSFVTVRFSLFHGLWYLSGGMGSFLVLCEIEMFALVKTSVILWDSYSGHGC